MVYKLYFQINDKKFKVEVNAGSKAEAKLKLLEKIEFIKIEGENPEEESSSDFFNFDRDGDPVDYLKQMFGMK